MRTSKSNLGGAQTITNADVYSPTIGLDQAYGYAIQAIWTGASLAGSVKLQSTVDGSTWSDVSGSSQSVSGPGSNIWNVQSAFYTSVRAYFTYSSGSGGITFWEQTKGP